MKKKKLLKAITYICSCLFLFGAAFFVSGCESESNQGSIEEEASYTVKFELCTELQTNKIIDRKVNGGQTVDEPNVAIRGDNPKNLQIVGWYTDSEYLAQWDFDFDLVTSDLTLYAKWEGRFAVDFYLGEKTSPIATTLIKDGRKAEPCEDKCYGYDVIGYFTSPDYTEEFDFDQPITQNTKIYIQAKDYLYYDATSISNGFAAFAGAGGSIGSPTAGSIAYEEKDGESYTRVDFGYSNSADPYIAVEYTDVDIRKSQSIEVRFKNLGDAYQMALLWVAKDEFGFVGKSEYNAENSHYYDLGAYRNMREDDEWVTIRFDLADLKLNWRESTSLYSLRLQSCYNSHNPTENPNTHCKPETVPNVMLIKSIKGVYDERYDSTKCLVTYHIGENIATQRVSEGEKLKRNDAVCVGYKVLGYYCNAELSEPFDFNSAVTEDMDIYVKTENYIYLDGASIAGFSSYPPTDGNGKAGSVTLSENGEYAVADFGYALALADSYVALVNVQIDRMGCKKLQLTIKNLGGATQFAIYWQGIDVNGNQQSGWSPNRVMYYGFSENQKNMSADGEWITITLDLSGVEAWNTLETITALRIESGYQATSETDLSNVWYIKEIKGIA